MDDDFNVMLLLDQDLEGIEVDTINKTFMVFYKSGKKIDLTFRGIGFHGKDN